ncbi:MAG: tRNA (N(6)-L-threonylcarbamoyladenosine(37)-C(2))-methylthiotransferase MtaB [Clostridia bacterium]
MNFSFHTLGCKVNQFETNSLKEIVLSKGYTICDEKPDVFIINTCTVTAISDKKNIKLIKKIKNANKNAIIAVCGCFAQVSPEKASQIDGVDIICGTSNRADVINMCIDCYESNTKYTQIAENPDKNEFEVLPISLNSNRTRELLKIQDGCNNFCSYCIIPYARGRSRSLKFDDVIHQTQQLSNLGTKEIIITGIEIASYGLDIDTSLTELIAYLCKNFPNIRFRLGSLEPRVITDIFCETLCNFNNLVPHFHLSLQSGCDAVLKRMNRKYNTELFYENCCKLRKYFINPSITTDLIVGFPQETNDEFQETLEFIEKCNFSSMHIFPYSIREGTSAEKMSSHISTEIKNSRAKQAISLANSMENLYLTSFIGKEIDVIIELPKNNSISGHSQYHFPVECVGENFERGKLYKLTVSDVKNNKIYAKN